MNRVETTLPERLGSVAWRHRTPLRMGFVPPLPAWSLAGRPEEDDLIGDGPTARTERLARLETVLFLAREPFGSRKLADLAGLADGTRARTLVRKLNRLYDEEGCAFRAVEVAGGFQLVSRPQFASYLRRLHGPAMEVRLSAPAMETLSVVAYRQPVLRAEIEAIRGVQCGELLRQLMERDLVRISGRSEELGRPFLYGTTKRFLQVFGLRHLDELPPVETELAFEEIPHASDPEPQSDDGQPDGLATPPDEPRLTEKEESTVKIEIEGQEIIHPVEELSQTPASENLPVAEFEAESSFDDEDEDDYEYEDDEYEDEDDEYDEDFEDSEDSDEDYEEEDDGFEDSDWEEVEDDDEDDDWEDEDWDEEDEDDEWEDEEDEDDWD